MKKAFNYCLNNNTDFDGYFSCYKGFNKTANNQINTSLDINTSSDINTSINMRTHLDSKTKLDMKTSTN